MYVDTVLGHTKKLDNSTEHMKILCDFFKRVRNAKLSLKPSKWQIKHGKIEFLGQTLHIDVMESDCDYLTATPC